MSETKRIGDALQFIMDWGGIDGAHHKQWTLDQVVRILTINEDGYQAWRREQANGEDGPNTYSWDEGIAP